MALITLVSLFRIAASALACTATATFAQAVEYRIDANFTRVHWEVSHFGTSTARGRFDDVSGSLQFDRAQATAAVSIVVRTASVSTGVAPLDAILRSSYLRSKDEPLAYFVTGASSKVGLDHAFEISGEFTLRGISRPLVLRSTGIHCATPPALQREVCGADLQGELRRSDFGITDGLPFIADTVRLVIEIEAMRD